MSALMNALPGLFLCGSPTPGLLYHILLLGASTSPGDAIWDAPAADPRVSANLHEDGAQHIAK